MHKVTVWLNCVKFKLMQWMTRYIYMKKKRRKRLIFLDRWNNFIRFLCFFKARKKQKTTPEDDGWLWQAIHHLVFFNRSILAFLMSLSHNIYARAAYHRSISMSINILVWSGYYFVIVNLFSSLLFYSSSLTIYLLLLIFFLSWDTSPSLK